MYHYILLRYLTLYVIIKLTMTQNEMLCIHEKHNVHGELYC